MNTGEHTFEFVKTEYHAGVAHAGGNSAESYANGYANGYKTGTTSQTGQSKNEYYKQEGGYKTKADNAATASKYSFKTYGSIKLPNDDLDTAEPDGQTLQASTGDYFYRPAMG